MKNRWRTWLALIGTAVILGSLGLGCGTSEPATSPGSGERGAATSEEEGVDERDEYRVEGVVVDVIPEKNRVRIAHEEIPGYMAAMTMLFDVKDSKELEGLQPQDRVRFLMVVTRDDGWIEEVQRLGQATDFVTEEPSQFRLVKDVDPLMVGDEMPDYTFTNEVGQVTRLSDYKGQALALTFIFTRCPFPTFCPRMSSHFQSAYSQLKSMEDGPDNWHMLSVTIDPQFDTPSVLRSYAERYTYDPERWNYVTGKLMDITAIAEQFGLQFYRPDPNNPLNISHNLRTVVIDAAGKVSAILIGNEWQPEELTQAMVEAARVEQ